MVQKVFFLFQLLFLLVVSCNSNQKNLDDLKTFKEDDKYFKAGLISLHFKIETSPIPTVDSLFRNFVDTYNIPFNANGCPDGVYIGESPYDAYDYKHIIKIQIKDEKIISADYNETHFNGSSKQEDSIYCKEMSVTGTTPAIAYPNMEKQLIEKQNMMEIDGVSGASYSLYRFRYATMIALMRAHIKQKN